jgi:putative ABC transport system permease protein
MSGFGMLHLRRLKEHPGRTVLSLVGVAVGSLLIVSVNGLFGSLTGSVSGLSRQFGRFPVEVSGTTNAGVNASLTAVVRATAGVASATPVVETPVTAGGVEALLVGADPSASSPIGGLNGCLGPATRIAFSAGPLVVIGQGLAHALGGAAADSTVTLSGNAHDTRATVAAVLDCTAANHLNGGLVVAGTLATAEQLAGRGARVDSVFVTADAGVATDTLIPRLQSVVGGQAVVSSTMLQAKLAEKELQPLQQGLLLAISVVLVVAGFLVFNTMSMAALERRRELATLRAIGGSRRRLLIGFIGEAAVLGAVGSLIGALGGIVVASQALHHVPDLVLSFLAVRPRFMLPRAAVPTGVAVGVVAAVVAAGFAARSAVTVPPVEAMRPEGVLEGGTAEGRTRPALAVIGGALFVGGALTMLLDRDAPGPVLIVGFGATTLGMLIATFGVQGLLARGAASFAAGLGATGRLAAAGIERSPRRVWATMLTVAVGAGTVVGLGSLLANQSHTFARDYASFGDSTLWVQTGAADTIPVSPDLPLSWKAEIAAIPGVASVVQDQTTYLTLGGEQLLLVGWQPGSNDSFLRDADAAGTQVLAGRGLVASRAWATHHHLQVGDPVGLPTPTGLHTEPIAAIVDLPPPVQGELGIDFADLTTWFGRNGNTDIEVDVRQGASIADVTRQIDAIIGHSTVPAAVFSGHQIVKGAEQSLAEISAIFKAMVWAVVAATALAVFNTMAITVVERRRELGILRALGTSRRMVRRVVLVEAATITAGGLGLGVILGLLQQVAGDQGTAVLTGFTVHYAFVYAPLLTAVVASAAMAMVGGAGPAWRAGNVDVLSAIGYE